MISRTTLNFAGEHQVGLSPTTFLAQRRFICPYLATPVSHKIYGVPQTINSANYVYFLAMNELFQLEPGSLFSTVSTRVANVEGPQNNITPINPYSNLSQAFFPDLRPVDQL